MGRMGVKLVVCMIIIVTTFHVVKAAVDPLQCELDLINMLDVADTRNLEMIDYTGKAVNDMGNYDGCQRLDPSYAQYCVAKMSIPVGEANEHLPVYVGLCVPASCSDETLEFLLKVLLESPRWNISQRLHLDSMLQSLTIHCVPRHLPALSAGATVSIVLIVFLATLVGVGTFLEFELDGDSGESEKVTIVAESGGGIKEEVQVPLVNRAATAKKKKQFRGPLGVFVAIAKCFGLRANIKFLMADNRSSDPKLACLNGLRTIMMCWVILGHTFTSITVPVGYDNLFTVQDLVKTVSFQVIPAAEMAVDAFFYLSGFLVVYMLLKEMNAKKGRVPWFLFYFHRYWRLTPVYAFIILVYTTLSPYFVQGPFHWLYIQEKTSLCSQHWWANLIYLNNFIPSSSGQQCMGWGWYLANDMQFYIVTPLLVLIFRKSRKAGWFVASFLVALSMSLNAILAYKYGFGPLDPNDNNYNTIVYTKPYTRMCTYLVGIMVAYLFQEDIDLSTNKVVRWIGYIIAGTTTTCVVYLTYGYWRSGWDTMQNILYITFAKTGFTMGVAWAMYCFHKGHGGPFRYFLSMYFWVPLARLTYCAYLIHPAIMFVINYSETTVFHYSNIYMTIRYSAHIMLAYVFAVVFHLVVEKPCANLERVLLPRGKH